MMKKQGKIVGVGLIILLFFATCRKDETPLFQTAAKAETLLDVSYGSDPMQKMDVYLPINRTSNTNVIIFIHGGSFIGGDKSEFNSQAKYLAARGYAVLNVNYRLVNATGLNDIPPLHQLSAVKLKIRFQTSVPL
jgi:acetyl esterase/lipase